MAQIDAYDKRLSHIKKILYSIPEYYYLSLYSKSLYVNIAFDQFIKSKGKTFPHINKKATNKFFKIDRGLHVSS
jgi:hypothetical protein